MARIHLFEFEDLQWFPNSIRNYMTDFLQFLSNKTKLYKGGLPLLVDVLKENEINHIVDLASGGGGGLLWLNEEVKKEIPTLKITLTDYYPNINAFKQTQKHATNVEYIKQSIDARKVPKELTGLRTQFLSLHHFQPEDARLIIANAIDSNQPIAIFEAQERSFPSILAMVFSPISVLLTTPFIKPFSLGRIIFTYLIPIVPLFVMWDGIVSSLRTYSVKEMNDLVTAIPNHDSYKWKIGKIKSGPGVVLYLIGSKKKN
jgi:hypothetical protein